MATPKQLRQRREMGCQNFGRNDPKRRARNAFNTEFRERKPPAPTGHADIGTDADVQAYLIRMGYVEVVK